MASPPEFGQRHPRLTGALCLLLFGPVFAAAAVNVQSWVSAAVAGTVGLGFALMIILRGHRLPGWASALFFLYVVGAGLFTGRRRAPATQFGWVALFSLGTFLVAVSLAVLGGLRRVPPNE